MKGVKLQLWPLDKLAPYARNARKHPEAQIEQLIASIAEFGFVGAVIVRNGVIAKGHGSMEAVRRLYATGEAVYPAPGKKGGAEPFPEGQLPAIDVSGWTDEQFRAYVIADNRLAQEAGWDENLLKLELTDLDNAGFDIEVTGFDLDDLDKVSASSGVSEVAVSELADRFWISLRGPLKQQAKVLKALRDATAGLEGVEVELGTISNENFSI